MSLLDEIDAEFGKPSKKKRPKRAQADIRKETIYERNSTGTWSDDVADASVIVKSWGQKPGFTPTRRITYVVTERCRCCLAGFHREAPMPSSYIGNVFTEFTNSRLKSKVWAPELVLEDEFGFELPHSVSESFVEVEQCAKCVRLSRGVSDLLVDLVTLESNEQLPLFINGSAH